jgi:hypothetical protein
MKGAVSTINIQNFENLLQIWAKNVAVPLLSATLKNKK